MLYWNDHSRNVLSAFWLRPYSALIRIIEESILDISNKDTGFSLDLGCGDGVFSALLKGHRFSTDFSPYIDVPIHSHRIATSDSLAHTEDYDLFNTSNGAHHYRLNQLSKPQWSLGVDHKENMISKATELNAFKECNTLDFDDPNIRDNFLSCLGSNKINYAYSNSLYWARNPRGVLEAVANSMDSGSVFQTSLVTPEMIKTMTYSRLYKSRPATASFLDKGRHHHYKSVQDPASWVHLFKSVGFEEISITPYLSKDLAFAVEELDQREHYPYIAKMYHSLPTGDRIKIKEEWLDHLEKLLMAFLSDYTNPTIDKCCYFVLSAIK